MQALLKIGLTIRTRGQCAEGGGMLSAPGGAVTAQIAQNSRSGRAGAQIEQKPRQNPNGRLC